MAQYEIEFRCVFDEAKHKDLNTFLQENSTDLGADDKRVWFFVMPDRLLKVTHNISKQTAKVTLKLTKIGHGSSFEEIEYSISESDVEHAIRMFTSLGHDYLLEPTILRHNYEYKGVEIAVKYSKSWGYHAELEILVDDLEKKDEAERVISEVAKELDLKIMSDEELKAFTNTIETNYVHPPEATI